MPTESLREASDRLDAEFASALASRKLLRENAPGTSRERLTARIKGEASIQQVIDGACRQWANGRGWPAMRPDATEFVWDRISEARHFCGWLLPKGGKFDGVTTENVLVFLLVEYWVLAGCLRWRNRLNSMS